ncbi:MAG TPA: hypothetical protein VIL85_10755 [Thermomicrobiales bacterium]|jgi:hypothetical protein
MGSASDERMAQLLTQLRKNPALTGSLPGEEGAIVESALGGANVYSIAQEREISTEAVWATLGNAARLLSGQEPTGRVEVGGLGSDTDPGINGGYGDTGFGAIDNEPPYPTPEEPREGDLPTGRDPQ